MTTDRPHVVIRTSDRQAFKRCRRKWHFASHLRLNRDAIEGASYFWIGTGGHFAMEDYHGCNYYGSPVKAFQAYVIANEAWAQKSKYKLPADYTYQAELGEGILDYYTMWLEDRDPIETVWVDGEPLVEQVIRAKMPSTVTLNDIEHDIYYQATIDRLVVIEGEYWVLDYKFYAQFQQGSLDFDQQMTAYCWLAEAVFEVPIAGAILHQFRKTLPKIPKINTNGQISTDKAQLTTRKLYRDVLIDRYGDTRKATPAHIETLNHFAGREGPDWDPFIRRDKTYRNQAQIESEGSRILMEIEEMTNPDLPIYTNPTRTCEFDCQFNDVCLAVDRDEDWEDILYSTTVSRKEEKEGWRDYLPEVV